MIATDCHMHSSFSSDSDTPAEVMIRTAIDKGLETICFTDHMDYDFPDRYELSFVFEPDIYFEELDKLAVKYSSYINVLKGIEIGLKLGTEEKYNDLLNKYPWDFVIGSVHIIDELDPYYQDYWNSGSELELIKRYYETIWNCINSFNNFDSLGHLDYILRYVPSRKNGEKSYLELADKINDYDYLLITDILGYIIENNIALEINSAGYKAGMGQPNPSPAIIKKYIEMGGKLFTIGSDAHIPDYVAGSFEEVDVLLKNIGVSGYTVYKGRKASSILL